MMAHEITTYTTTHSDKVRGIADAVACKPDGQTISIRKNTPHHQIHSTHWKDTCYRVDVSNLNQILGFKETVNRDGERVTVAICEGQVTMGQLSAYTFHERGMIPRVVPEYDNFTCAGLINGEGIQTSGHRYGLFTNTVTELEVVLGDASVHTVTPNLDDPQRDLFMSVCESYGSIGIVTLVCVTLRPAKQYVRSSFLHFEDSDSFARAVFKKTKAGAGDFLEGLVLAKDSYILIQSEFTDSRDPEDVYFEPGPTQYGEMWYYQHIQQRVVQRGRIAVQHDLIPTLQFLHRSVRGAWWMVECHVGCAPLTNRRFMRKLIDKKAEQELQSKGGFGVQTNDALRCVVLQDMGMKLTRLNEAIQYVNSRLGVFPLWVCPVYQKHQDRNPNIALQGDNEPVDADDCYFCDVGIYGEPTVKPFYHRRAVKDLIEFVDYPSKWGTTYRTKEQIAAEYQHIRQRYHAIGAFTGVEDKVTLRNATDDANSAERDIFMFRLRRDYGRFWPVVFPAVMMLFFGVTLGLPALALYYLVTYLMAAALF
jgi:delta24-sterol reductase